MLVKSTIGILFIIFTISSPLFAGEKSTNAVTTEKEENYLIEIDEKGNVKIPEFRNPNVDYTKVEEEKKKSVVATNNVGSTIPVVQKPPLVIKPIFDKEPIDYSKPPNPDFGMLAGQFLGGMAGASTAALLDLGLIAIGNRLSDMTMFITYFVPLCYIGTVSGVILAGEIGGYTADFLPTVLWSLGTSLIGSGMIGSGIVFGGAYLSYYNLTLAYIVMGVGVTIAVISPIVGAMIGFNSTLRYKEGYNPNPVSVSAYEIEKNGQKVTDLVITANVLSIAF